MVKIEAKKTNKYCDLLLKCHLRKYMNYENTYPEECNPVKEKIHWKYYLKLWNTLESDN